MQVYWDIAGLGALKDWPELLVIDKLTSGQAMHHCARESILGYAALQLIGSPLRVWRGQAGKGGKPVGTGQNNLLQPVIRSRGELYRSGRVHLLRPGRCVR